MRVVIDEAIELIKSFEGFSSNIYKCPSGFCTIGYGHIVYGNENYKPPISQDQACDILKKDIAKLSNQVVKLIKTHLDDYQFAAIISFCFNVGAGTFQRSTLRQKINYGEHYLVPNEFRKYIYGRNGIKLPGLIRRREAEIALYVND